MQISTQTDNSNLRKNVATDKKKFFKKRLKLQNPKFNIFWKVALSNKQNFLTRIIYFNLLRI